VVSKQDLAAVHAAVDALPPMTDEQIDAICETIQTARARWHTQNTPHHPT